MGLRIIILNALLALALALPLTALETRLSNTRHDYFKPAESITADAGAIHESEILRNTRSDADLLDMVSRKVAPAFSAHKVERQYDAHIREVSARHGVSPALVKAVIKVESGFDPDAVSSVGAVGLMQILPETAKRVGVSNPRDPQANIIAGVKYLKILLSMFDGDEALAVAAYNSGPSRVKRYGGIPPYRQTQVFVDRVMSYYRSYMNS